MKPATIKGFLALLTCSPIFEITKKEDGESAFGAGSVLLHIWGCYKNMIYMSDVRNPVSRKAFFLIQESLIPQISEWPDYRPRNNMPSNALPSALSDISRYCS